MKDHTEIGEPLFRGLGNADWSLETTLERSLDARIDESLLTYYRKVVRTKPMVESLLDRRWDPIPNWPEFDKLVQDWKGNWLDSFLANNVSIYEYLIYLRHHGFPSPILDWTVSPYVAAAFAFDAMGKGAGAIAIWVYGRNKLQGFGSDRHLFVVGPYLRTHPRHYFQQSRYSLCVKLEITRHSDKPSYDYQFLSHEEVLLSRHNQDIVTKILIPASERPSALRDLDSMNINPYSLYGSEDSLVRTVARREMLFKNG